MAEKTQKETRGRPRADAPTVIKSFGDWLRAKRVERGLSQQELSRLTGMTNVSVFETGKYKSPSMAVIVRIENVLGTIPDEFKRVRR